MRRPSFGQLSMSPQHPWQFIEEVAGRQVEKDLNSVYSRLVLCKTFRLDEDNKILSPEELLFRVSEFISKSPVRYNLNGANCDFYKTYSIYFYSLYRQST